MGMWNLVRTLLFALAMVGFVGQASAYATPFQTFETMGGAAEMDCAEMMVMADEAAGGAMGPCSDMTPECIAKMGCAVVAPVFSPGTSLAPPRAEASPDYGLLTLRIAGIATAPLKSPPKPRP